MQVWRQISALSPTWPYRRQGRDPNSDKHSQGKAWLVWDKAASVIHCLNAHRIFCTAGQALSLPWSKHWQCVGTRRVCQWGEDPGTCNFPLSTSLQGTIVQIKWHWWKGWSTFAWDDHVLVFRLAECQVVCGRPLTKQHDCFLKCSVVMIISDEVI